MMRGAGSALVLALLAGCAAPHGEPAFLPHADGNCLGSVELTWSQPGLFAHLERAAARGDVETVKSVPWTDPVRVDHPLLAERWDGSSLMQVAWSAPDGSLGMMRLSPWIPGEWRLEASITWDEATLRAHTGSFLDGLGLGEHPERAAWERAIVASRHQGPYPVAYVVARPDLGALVDRLESETPSVENDTDLGHGSLSWGLWRLTFEIGTLNVREETNDGLGLNIAVDEEDRVRAWTELRPGELPDPTVRARTNATFERIGLPTPTFEGARGGGGYRPC